MGRRDGQGGELSSILFGPDGFGGRKAFGETPPTKQAVPLVLTPAPLPKSGPTQPPFLTKSAPAGQPGSPIEHPYRAWFQWNGASPLYLNLPQGTEIHSIWVSQCPAAGAIQFVNGSVPSGGYFYTNQYVTEVVPCPAGAQTVTLVSTVGQFSAPIFICAMEDFLDPFAFKPSGTPLGPAPGSPGGDSYVLTTPATPYYIGGFNPYSTGSYTPTAQCMLAWIVYNNNGGACYPIVPADWTQAPIATLTVGNTTIALYQYVSNLTVRGPWYLSFNEPLAGDIPLVQLVYLYYPVTSGSWNNNTLQVASNSAYATSSVSTPSLSPNGGSGDEIIGWSTFASATALQPAASPIPGDVAYIAETYNDVLPGHHAAGDLAGTISPCYSFFGLANTTAPTTAALSDTATWYDGSSTPLAFTQADLLAFIVTLGKYSSTPTYVEDVYADYPLQSTGGQFPTLSLVGPVVESVSVTAPITNTGTATNPDIGLTMPLPISDGGTGSTTQNFVDLTSNQSAAGNKTWSGSATFDGVVDLPGTSASLEIGTPGSYSSNGVFLVLASGYASNTSCSMNFFTNNVNAVEGIYPHFLGMYELYSFGVGQAVLAIDENGNMGLLGALHLGTPLAIAYGGTGSATQPFVDLTTAQTAAGVKTWSSLANFSNGIDVSGAVGSFLGGSANSSSGGGYINLGPTATNDFFLGIDYYSIQAYFHNPGLGIVPAPLYLNYNAYSGTYATTYIGTLQLAVPLANSQLAGPLVQSLTITTPSPLSNSGTAANPDLVYSAAGPYEIQGVENGVTSGTSIATKLLYAPTSGNLLLAFIIGEANQTPTPPTGWTNLYSYFSGVRLDCFYKISAGTEQSTTWTVGSATTWGVYVSETNRTSIANASVLAGESIGTFKAWQAANGTYSNKTLIYATFGASTTSGNASPGSISPGWNLLQVKPSNGTSMPGYLTQKFADYGEYAAFAPKCNSGITANGEIMAGVALV